MITLGINAAFHDSAAALVVDGRLVAAAEEERFTRIKHAKRPVPFTVWELPWNAMDFCLGAAGVTLAEVDHVAYSFDPRAFVDAELRELPSCITLPLSPRSSQVSHVNPWDGLTLAYVVNAPDQLADGAPHHLKRRFEATRPAPYGWHFVGHHLAHQASAFLAAPFDRAAVLTLDGRGERATTTYGVYAPGADGAPAYTSLGQVDVPHSLGLVYEQATTHLGFLHSSDEYKVMALAALGTPRWKDTLAAHVHVEGGAYRVDPIDWTRLAGPPRRRGAPLEQRHFDLAASLQVVLERTALALAKWLQAASGGERHLAMAGGVALNCVMNAKLRDAGLYDAVWVQPAAGDAGTALGAALWIDAVERGAGERPEGPALTPRRWRMEHAYWGPEFDDATIEKALSWAKLPYRRIGGSDPRAVDAGVAEAVAERLAEGAMVGWFQGRMEFGPRALGARSILASPIDPEMQARLNELKDREDFRPVAPVVPVERLADWFQPATANGGTSPFMLFVYDTVPERSGRIPSACHSDGTARVQTVDRATNPRFHALLEAFERRTGVPVLVNTSFNVRGEPVVCTPKDAIEAFFSTPLDVLAIGRFLVEKPR